MKRVGLGLLLVLAVILTAFVVVSVTTGSKRAERMSRIEAPLKLRHHIRLAESKSAVDGGTTAPSELDNAINSIDVWSALFEEQAGSIDGKELQSLQNRWQYSKGWDGMSEADRGRLLSMLEGCTSVIGRLRVAAAMEGPTRIVVPATHAEAAQQWDTGVNNLASILSLDTVARSRNGDLDGAIANCNTAFQFSSSLASEPASKSLKAAIHVVEAIFNAMRDSFPPGSLTTGEIQGLLTQIQRLPGRDALVVAVIADNYEEKEKVEATLDGGWLLRSKSMEELLGGTAGESFLSHAFTIGYVSPLGSPWMNHHLGVFADYMCFRAELARMPYFEATLLESAQVEIQQSGEKFSPFIQHGFISDQSDLLREFAKHEARLRLLQIGLALEQQRIATHGYPQSLTALFPLFIQETFTDPFSGKGFRYEAQDETYCLYSVGPNGEDDSGNELDYWKEGVRGGYTAFGDDIRWRH